MTEIKYEAFTNDYGQDYIRWNDNGVIRLIPAEESNSDYQTYLRWLNGEDENGTIS